MNRIDYDPKQPHAAIVALGVIGSGIALGLLVLAGYLIGAAIYGAVTGA